MKMTKELKGAYLLGKKLGEWNIDPNNGAVKSKRKIKKNLEIKSLIDNIKEGEIIMIEETIL